MAASIAQICVKNIRSFPLRQIDLVYQQTSCVCAFFSTSSPLSQPKKLKHVINYQRTHAEVARALRKKQNFLHHEMVDKHRASPLQSGTEQVSEKTGEAAPRDYRFVMPEFLPNPDFRYRDKILEKMERQDMLRRRAVIDIPEFYVGSIMAVTVSDPHSPGKTNRFVGICIDRGGRGLQAYFVLRNVVDGLGVEVMYEMYNPTVHSIQVLKLEKRLDEQLYYLRNAPLEHSTFSFDMQPVTLPRDAPVPVNTTKVKLNPKPWEYRWERFNLKGIEPLELTPKMEKGIKAHAKPWEDYDLMLKYRQKVNEDEEKSIMTEVFQENTRIEGERKSSRAVLRRKK
ncbi:39S ribosomal protein L19, mitochondrial [Elysia marginata]|uniref:Large ribosomal subunit protein bL19m n=1 Tax=Elysia marginata TaxID=1093978 RepID=A0AAV4JXI4_9GAST|nr:39S ribosomal protein L19, mitochondrial [Elysia marginata]